MLFVLENSMGFSSIVFCTFFVFFSFVVVVLDIGLV